MSYKRKKEKFSYPLNLVFTATGSNLFRVQFMREVKFSFFYLRQVPTGGSINIFGSEFGPRILANEINAVNVFSVTNLVGAPTVSRVVNAFSLDATTNIQIFEPVPYCNRYLYIQTVLAGQHILNLSYQ